MSLWSRNLCNFPGAFPGHRRLARSPRLKTLTLAPKASTSAVTTTKKYSKLPKTRVLSDGELAPPLDAYLGGLDIKRSTFISSPTENAKVDELIKKPRKSRRTKVEETHDCPHDIPVTRKGRRSRKTASNDQPKVVKLEETSALPAVKKVGRPRNTTTKLQKEGAVVECIAVDTGNENLITKKTRPRTQHALPKKPKEEGILTDQPRNVLATEVRENLARFPHCILLTRVGQFYESYFDQAEEVSRLLNIKLANRGWDGHRVLMCGFPIVQLNKYLKVLVQQHNRFVAMCEEFMKDPLQGPAAGYNRRVVRVVTPGTLMDEPFLNPFENNYLLSVGVPDPSSRTVGLAWIDVSTGEFFTKASHVENLRDELVRLAPREVVLDKELARETPSDYIRQAILQEGIVVSYLSPSAGAVVPTGIQTSRQESVDDLTTADGGLPAAFSPHETTAIKLLITFLNENLMESMPQLPLPSKEASDRRMQIDAHTVKALEIREGMIEGGTAGSLLSVIKRTVTSSGTRLLARWLCSPSTSITEIHARQSLVAFFHTRPHIRDDLKQLLSNVEDSTRIVQKFLYGRGDLGDLSALNQSITVWNSIRKRIELERFMEAKERKGIRGEEWANLNSLMNRMHDLTNLSLRISASITRGDPSDVQDGEMDDTLDLINSSGMKWSIKSDFSDELSDLHERLKSILLQKEHLQRELQNHYSKTTNSSFADAASLTLRSSPSHGMFVHIGRAKRDAAKIKSSSSFARLSETGTTSTFSYQEWSKLGAQIGDITYAIHAAEKYAFDSLRNEVNVLAEQLRQNAGIIDELDVTLAFANLAIEMNFSRPQVTDDASYQIINGRHPTVELGLLTAGRLFTPNTVTLAPSSCLHIITGPNMAGKSTLLRQTALIAILAQTGSFVPADNAVIGVVDKVFSRVGAKDDLFRDRSTFMVEMLETSEILKRATPKSLVIMDEVGRGTTVEDGLAIAFATVHHLSSVNCRGLFATHFHELADMLGQSEENRGQGYFQNVRFFCTGVDETSDGYFTYTYRLKPGVNRDSHGLKVAQLAGMPESVLNIAEAALAWLKQKRKTTDMHRADDLRTLGQFLVKSGEGTF